MIREEEIKQASDKLFDDSTFYNKTYKMGFEAGAMLADNHPKLPWISVKDDLPYNHKELVKFNPFTNKYSTKFILVIDSNGCVQLTFMEYDKYDWIWNRCEVLYWMPIPELPKNKRIKI